MLAINAGARSVATILAEGGPSIRYAPSWIGAADSFPISLSMPLDREGHGPGTALPWLMNLLPEGDPLRAMTRALGVAREDVLGLIAETGRDLAGALTLGEAAAGSHPGYVKVGAAADLERIISELPARPFLVGEEGVSMSLAGAQDKLPVALVDGAIAIPVNGAASTHILKPDNPRLPGRVQNEALCMVLARRTGLGVAPVATGRAGARSYLLVERYDRLGQGPDVRRIHQEDLCQALGRPPSAKYEHNQSGGPGPSLADMFALVRDHMTARDTNRLLDAVIFNIAIGNVDSHAKNYSILLSEGRPRLAPLYDLMSGLDRAHVTSNHAQSIGGQRRGRHIYARHWRRMAEACGLSRPGVARRVESLIGRLLSELPAAVEAVADMPTGSEPLLTTFANSIVLRAELVRANAIRQGDEFDEAIPGDNGAAEGISEKDRRR